MIDCLANLIPVHSAGGAVVVVVGASVVVVVVTTGRSICITALVQVEIGSSVQTAGLSGGHRGDPAIGASNLTINPQRLIVI
jgi:hypothetical protein